MDPDTDIICTYIYMINHKFSIIVAINIFALANKRTANKAIK